MVDAGLSNPALTVCLVMALCPAIHGHKEECQLLEHGQKRCNLLRNNEPASLWES